MHVSPSPEHLQLVREAAIANDLGPYVERLQELIRPSVVLATSRAKAAEIATGGTKIGGAPDMPDSLNWPMWNDDPLTFVGQINLTEISPFQLGLPCDGLLLFFLCFDRELKAVRPQNTGAGVVVYVHGEKLIPRKAPKDVEIRFRKCSVKYIPYPSLPPAYSDGMGELWGLEFLANDELHGAYVAVIDSIDEALGIDKLATHDGYNYHQLLGYPQPVQGTPIEIEMERARTSPPPPSPPPPPPLSMQIWDFILSRNRPIQMPRETPRPPDDLTRARDWQLLLMLQEDEHAGIQLIDSGRIYFMYPSEQLRRWEIARPWTMLDFG